MCNLLVVICSSYAVAKKDVKEFTKDHALKNDDKTIKAGMFLLL